MLFSPNIKRALVKFISGGVYRFERGNIIVDLGKTEAILPRNEQSSKEEFKQGDRIRTYILDVTREVRGPQVILSRANPNFVKRLFELEVPEIYEGIVEIKSISRAVGERTKIAVYSKDEKVDCVGACVGMRGARVKNIVAELQGEKIDIVRYSDDIKEYIQAALSPAEISQIQINSQDREANLIVADDQLSLAIGRRGQNVRLAGELVGWTLNIFTADQWKKHQEDNEQSPDEKPIILETIEKMSPSLQGIKSVGDKILQTLQEAGLDSLEKIANANLADLTQIKGLGKIKAEKLLEEAKFLFEQDSKKSDPVAE